MDSAVTRAQLRQLLNVRGERVMLPSFVTGLAALDALMPDAGLARGAVHEVIADGDLPPVLLAAILARSAAGNRGLVVLSDPKRVLYPPALAALGLPPERMMVLTVAKPADELWAVSQCLRCKGVAATMAAPARLTPVEARRLQLAAEAGGGVGILLRKKDSTSAHYAATSRWLVEPTPGDEQIQKWNVTLVHGHGRPGNGRSVVLEVCRGTNHVRAVDAVADRPGLAPPAARASA